jgi:hypothetical protein
MTAFKFGIQHHYQYKLHLDGLPSATIIRSKDGKEILDYFEGIPVGLYEKDHSKRDSEEKFMIFNHLRIEVLVHETYEGHMRVVGFEVEPFSLADHTPPKFDHA